jgi:hypothetical protein
MGTEVLPWNSSWNESVPPNPVSVTVWVSLPPEKSRSDTVCTSLMGGLSEVTTALISSRLRCDQ